MNKRCVYAPTALILIRPSEVEAYTIMGIYYIVPEVTRRSVEKTLLLLLLLCSIFVSGYAVFFGCLPPVCVVATKSRELPAQLPSSSIHGHFWGLSSVLHFSYSKGVGLHFTQQKDTIAL